MMRTRDFLFVAVVALVSSTLYAQTSAQPPGAAAPATTFSSATAVAGSKKSTHAQNYRFESAVLRAIYKNRSVGAVGIYVSGNAATGSVVLRGHINDPAQEQAAISAARQVAGVTKVTSRLTLQEHGDY
jgi:hyperosmotically inducible protein